MNNDTYVPWRPDITPTSLPGIKRLAKHIKREQGIKHNEALHEAARRAGFANFHDAQKKLTASEEP